MYTLICLTAPATQQFRFYEHFQYKTGLRNNIGDHFRWFLDGLHMTSVAAIFDDKQWKSAGVYALRETLNQ